MVSGYNDTVHSTAEMKPKDVTGNVDVHWM